MKVIDLFCGCGGFSLGFEMADFEIIYALDNWETACRSYKANFPYVDVDCRDALEVKPSEIPKADVIIGGPPCQEFSIAKEKRRTFDLTLVNWFLKVVEKLRPKYWIMENVPPLKDLLPNTFKKEIYKMYEYGVPQLRKRLFAGKFIDPKKSPTNIIFPTVVATEYKGLAGNRKRARLASVLRRRCLIPEAKLVQTFPIDYIVYGTLQEQYIQIGNAVPPLMAFKLAEAISTYEKTKTKQLSFFINKE